MFVDNMDHGTFELQIEPPIAVNYFNTGRAILSRTIQVSVSSQEWSLLSPSRGTYHRVSRRAYDRRVDSPFLRTSESFRFQQEVWTSLLRLLAIYFLRVPLRVRCALSLQPGITAGMIVPASGLTQRRPPLTEVI